MAIDVNTNTRKTFPRLSRPPIVEAVIYWRARAQSALNPAAVRDDLLKRLPEFKICEPFQHVRFEAEFLDEQGKPSLKHRRKSDWHGFRLASEDGPHVAQFNRDGVIFSCTREYDHWENFTAAARRVWEVFLDLAQPVEIERLGVRFINQFQQVTPENLSHFLVEPPTRVSNLPLKEFVYQSTLVVPQSSFEAKVIKVMQPTMPNVPQGTGLFVDIDVYLTTALQNEDRALTDALNQIRVLKNEIFFTLIRPEALHSFMDAES